MPPPAQPLRLVVVVDQARPAVGVGRQAVQRKAADLGRPAPGVDQQLDRRPHLAAGCAVDRDQARADLPDHLSWQRAASLRAGRLIRDIGAGEPEGLGQPVQRLAGHRQAQGAHPGQDLPGEQDMLAPPARAERARRLEVGEPVAESDDVMPGQARGPAAAVRPRQPQALRQPGDTVDLGLHVYRGLTAAVGEIVKGPRPDAIAEPWSVRHHDAFLDRPRQFPASCQSGGPPKGQCTMRAVPTGRRR